VPNAPQIADSLTWRLSRRKGEQGYQLQKVELERAVASLRSDLTVRALDDKLRQSQRLESIGRLAGGIAHDFNNLLMVIKSYTELAHHSLAVGDDNLRDKLREIDRAADRAADLIRQLLAFGRRQVIKPEVVNVNEMVLANYLKNEYPQTVAVVLSKIKPEHAAKVLGVLPEWRLDPAPEPPSAPAPGAGGRRRTVAMGAAAVFERV